MVSKLIIYLDQNFVSNMAKATFVGDQSLAGKLQDYVLLYDRLRLLVDDDKVIPNPFSGRWFSNSHSIEIYIDGKDMYIKRPGNKELKPKIIQRIRQDDHPKAQPSTSK
jgi:hypothetical protein